MIFPLTVSDLSLWLAVSCVIVLIASEVMFSAYSISSRVFLDRKILRYIGMGCGVAFLFTVLMHASGFM